MTTILPRLLAAFLAAGAIAAQALETPSDPSRDAPQDPEDEVDGRQLYLRHCAGCHNENGDGRGKTMLDQGKAARSFAQGGFAFGNTPQAIYGTITEGIPGSSLMQSFKSVMDDDERRLVADYVLTLTPYKAARPATDSILAVGERAVIARGKLPAIAEGLPERPRGLLVGLPGGWSFEYRTDRGRLLAVRRGAFADRTDWNERGGGVLKPLGDFVYADDRGDPAPFLYSVLPDVLAPVELALAATRVPPASPTRAEIEWKPLAQTGPGVLRIVERLGAVKLSAGEGFERELVIQRAADAPLLLLWLGSWPQDAVQRDPRISEQGERESPWFVLKREGMFDLVYVDGNSGGSTFSPPRDGNLRLGFTYEAPAKQGPLEARLRVVQVRSKRWDDALLRRLTEELAR